MPPRSRTKTPPAMRSPLEEPFTLADAERLAAALKVIAEPRRLMLLSLAAQSGEEGFSPSTARESAGRQQPTISHHMALMHRYGLLVVAGRRGTRVFYRLDRDRLNELLMLLVTP